MYLPAYFSPSIKQVRSVGFILILLVFTSQESVAAVPEALEPRYSAAIIDYNQKHYKEAGKSLDELITENGSIIEFFQLKALTLKTSGDNVGAGQVYEKLIQLEEKNGTQASEIAPYHFERGLVAYRSKQFADAEREFKISAEKNFNVSAANYFLALIHFQFNDYEQAGQEFSRVTGGDIDELKPASNFYLGQIYLRGNYPSGAAQSLIQARSESEKILANSDIDPETKKTAKLILEMSQESLKPFDHSGYYGNVALITTEDTNVLSVPSSTNSLSSPTGAINQGSVKETLQAGVGYMTSPVATWQYAPSFRSAFNYNFNQDTISGEFLTNDVALYITHNALARFSYGFHVDGIYTLQNNFNPFTNSAGLQSYSLQIPFGPYIRYEIWQHWSLQASLDFMPQNFYLDAALPDPLKRSGLDVATRVSLKKVGVNRYWNPGFGLVTDLNGASGNEYSSKSFTLEMNNTFHILTPLDLVVALDYGGAYYSSRPAGSRFDNVYAIDANGVYHFNPKWSILGDVQFIDNISTIPSQYQFTRALISVGVGYSF